jgi:hypothetical protein
MLISNKIDNFTVARLSHQSADSVGFWKTLRMSAKANPKKPRAELLHNLQNLVIQGAALSRYFWPARPGHDSRAAFLRQSLAVAEDSPLKNRDLRNEIEHFDEKLEAHLGGGIVGHFSRASPDNSGSLRREKPLLLQTCC